jgi:hypothetical protein
MTSADKPTTTLIGTAGLPGFTVHADCGPAHATTVFTGNATGVFNTGNFYGPVPPLHDPAQRVYFTGNFVKSTLPLPVNK